MDIECTDEVKILRENLCHWAIERKTRIRSEKLALIVLCASIYNTTRECNPSIQSLAELGICSKWTAMRAIKGLIEQGFISVTKSSGKRNKYTINYSLALPSILDELPGEDQ